MAGDLEQQEKSMLRDENELDALDSRGGQMKVFSVHQFLKDMEKARWGKDAELSLANGWPQRCDGLTQEEMMDKGFCVDDDWEVDKKDFIPYEIEKHVQSNLIEPTSHSEDRGQANTVLTVSSPEEVAIWYDDNPALKEAITKELKHYGYCTLLSDDLERTFIEVI